jgi:hypothetical protein
MVSFPSLYELKPASQANGLPFGGFSRTICGIWHTMMIDGAIATFRRRSEVPAARLNGVKDRDLALPA